MGIGNKRWIITVILIFLINQGLAPQAKAQNDSSPNVLLITIDALRPDHLGCYGYRRSTSPNIDKLAKEGVLFTEAIAQSSFTMPSVASIMTSKHPSEAGVNKDFLDLADFNITLAEILRNNGYRTMAIMGHSVFYNFRGFKRGFKKYLFPDGITNCNAVDRVALKWLKEGTEEPFFLWIHYIEPHGELSAAAPASLVQAYCDDGLYENNRSFFGNGKLTSDMIGLPAHESLSDIDINYYVADYDARIRWADMALGRLLLELKNNGAMDNTLVIISADHGESLVEHGQFFSHSDYLYDSLLRVPLIIRFPQRSYNGMVVKEQVQHIDIMPTILDFLKINSSEIKMEGGSLLPLITKKGKYSAKYAYSEIFSAKREYAKTSIRSSGWKLILTKYDNGNIEYELYDLNKDPRELNNLFGIEKAQSELLKGKINSWLNLRKPNIKSLARPLDEKTENKLKALGYLQ